MDIALNKLFSGGQYNKTIEIMNELKTTHQMWPSYKLLLYKILQSIIKNDIIFNSYLEQCKITGHLNLNYCRGISDSQCIILGNYGNYWSSVSLSYCASLLKSSSLVNIFHSTSNLKSLSLSESMIIDRDRMFHLLILILNTNNFSS